MKLFTLIVGLILCTSSAVAQTTADSAQQQNQTSTSIAATNGNTQQVVFTDSPGLKMSQAIQDVNYSGSQTVKNVPSMGGPALTTSNDTCMGSGSGAIAGPGFGISIGKTYTDDNCVMLKNGRELWNMGMKGAALALLCRDTNNREALEITGYECPQTAKARKEASQTQVASQGATVAQRPGDQYLTDPIVRARVGLPPLAK